MLSHRITSNDNNESLPVEVSELSDQIGKLPEEYRDRLLPGLKRVVDMTKRRRRILSLVQEALGQLRLDMKYLMFDLDATRSERDGYRNSLEGENNEGENNDGEFKG